MESQDGMRQRSGPQTILDEYAQLSLRERFAKLYRENPPDFTVKKDMANRYGVGYFIVSNLLQLYMMGWVIVPHIGQAEHVIWWKLACSLLVVQCFYNWFQCCRKYVNKAERRPEDSTKTEMHGWRLCAICQYYAPPRSHHCKLCRACILRHDHHCYFAAGCIGQFTTAYFVFMSLWIVISECVVLYWLVAYSLAEFSSGWMYFPPTALWASCTKAQPWFNCLLLLVAICVLVNIIAAGFYLLISMYAATDNVTFYEGSRGIRRYRKGSVLANIRAAWGSYYWIRWIVPFYSAPDGDGYNWNISRHEQ